MPNTETSGASVPPASFSLPVRAGGGLWVPREPQTKSLSDEVHSPLAVEMLLQCHQRVAAQCETLQRLCAYLPTHGVDEQARSAATAVMRYFDTAAPLHHADEEQDWLGLLRPLWAQQAERLALLERLRAEHRQLEALWQLQKTALQSVVAAPDGQSLRLSPESVEAFVQAYHAHIAFEEGQWLVLAQQALKGPALDALASSMVARRRQA